MVPAMYGRTRVASTPEQCDSLHTHGCPAPSVGILTAGKAQGQGAVLYAEPGQFNPHAARAAKKAAKKAEKKGLVVKAAPAAKKGVCFWLLLLLLL